MSNVEERERARRARAGPRLRPLDGWLVAFEEQEREQERERRRRRLGFLAGFAKRNKGTVTRLRAA